MGQRHALSRSSSFARTSTSSACVTALLWRRLTLRSASLTVSLMVSVPSSALAAPRASSSMSTKCFAMTLVYTSVSAYISVRERAIDAYLIDLTFGPGTVRRLKGQVLGDSRHLGGRCGRAPSERHVSTFGVDSDRVALAELALEQHHRQRVLYEALNRALQGTGSIDRVPTTLREQLACGISDHEMHPSVRQPVFESLQLNIDDGSQLLLGQRLEDDHLVDAVEKLGAEVFSQHGDHRVTHSFEVLAVHLLDQWATEIRRHDQNRVAEVDGPALAVRQTSIV